MNILRRVRENSRTANDLNYSFPREIETTNLTSEYLDLLREVLTSLLIEGATWEQDQHPHLRTKRPDLMAALVAACHRQCIQRVRTEPWVTSTLLAIRLLDESQNEKPAISDLKLALAGLPAEARERAFWKEAAFLAQLHQSRDAWHRAFDLQHYGGIRLNDETDANWIRRRLSDPEEPLDHREMMLWVEMLLLNHAAIGHRELLESLKMFVSDSPNLLSIIDNRLKPQEGTAQLRRLEAQNEKRAKQAVRARAKAHGSWVTFWREIVRDPSGVFAEDRAANTAWNLWDAVERSGRESRASGWNRRFIEAQFGKDVADKLRQTMMAAWRKDSPTLRSERPADQKNSFLVKWQFGLAGIAAEAEEPNWAKRLAEQEAELACRYAPLELNGFPSWLEGLAIEHPEVVDRVLGEELTLSMREALNADEYSLSLQNVSHTSAIIAMLFTPRVRVWLAEVAKADSKPSQPQFKQNLRQAIEILLKNGNEDDRCFIESTAKQRLADDLAVPFADVWLSALLHLNPSVGVEILEQGLEGCIVSTTGSGVQLFARLFDYNGGTGFNLRAPEFKPSLLLRLLRLGYQHVRIGDDAHHEGGHSPDTRDHAERGRNAILSALMSTTGPEGWAAKVELANDPLFAHFKDRAIAMAEEMAAGEADGVALTETEFTILDKRGEAPPTTKEAMFALMRDRLEDIDDLLLQDVSPREAWANISDEHVMRRELARELKNAANHNYTVDQESVTADEKETDIRLRSTCSNQQAIIELKLGDNRSGVNLFDTINDQLLTKYMAPDDCRAGCLLVTVARDRAWDHPKTGKRVGFEALIAVLNEEAERLSQELNGAAKLMVKGLDLRPRLKTEKNSVTEKRKARFP